MFPTLKMDIDSNRPRNITWNFPGFATKLFIQCKMSSISMLSFRKTSARVLAMAKSVLSSAKFQSSGTRSERNRSFKKILNKIGPNIDP